MKDIFPILQILMTNIRHLVGKVYVWQQLVKFLASAVLAVLAGLLVADVTVAQDTNDGVANSKVSTPSVSQLINQLGADEFVLREHATQRLFELGLEAKGGSVLGELQKATKRGDREISQRSQRVLRLLNDRLREMNLQQFVGGKDLAAPGWQEFAKKFGDSKSSRSIYAMILREEWSMLDACFQVGSESKATNVDQPPANIDAKREPTEAEVEAFARRRQAINQGFAKLLDGQRNYQLIPLGSLLAYYYVGERFPESFDLKSQLFYTLNAQTLTPYIRGNEGRETREIVRRLLADWMVKTTEQDPRYVTQGLAASLSIGLHEVSKAIAKSILKNGKSLPVNKRMAMQAVAALGDTSAIKLIEPFLKDTTLLQRNQKRLQLRDIALTCLMDLHGFEVEQIGVVRTPATSSMRLRSPYEYRSLGFDSDEKREAALQLYEKLVAEKKDAEPSKNK